MTSLSTTTPTTATSAPAPKPAELSRRIFALVDEQRWQEVLEYVAPDVRAHIGGQTLDRDTWVGMGQMFYASFPDGIHHVDKTIVSGEEVVSIMRWTGTHRGPFMGVPATGRSVSVPVITVDRFSNGKLVEKWVQMDAAGMMQALTAPSA